ESWASGPLRPAVTIVRQQSSRKHLAECLSLDFSPPQPGLEWRARIGRGRSAGIPPQDCIKLERVYLHGLHGAVLAHVDYGGDATPCEERQGVDHLFVGLELVAYRRQQP